jgi:8-oxo-dGTP pyrophosphatase MutT (NUDIX family)
MPEHLRKTLATWDGTAAVPRAASTVVILRGSAEDREVFLMRRTASMAFAAGMAVFPGGSLQPSDAETGTPWVGPSTERWAAAFGTDPATARASVMAAIRETFEETGILFAGSGDDQVVSTQGRQDLEVARRALEAGETSMSKFLKETALAVRADLLAPWAHWITPEFEPRRFDTRFFLAMLPAGQNVGTLATEAAAGGWMSLREAHAAGRSGDIQMMPPTLHTLGEILKAHEPDLLAAAWERPVRTIAPKAVKVGDDYWHDGPSGEEL